MQGRRANAATALLERAIEKLAPEVNAVEVTGQLPPDADALLVGEVGPHGLFRYVVHLPFSFTTGTHGSGERVALFASCETIQLQQLSSHHPVHVPLQIQGDRSERRGLDLRWVSTIRLIDASPQDLTPRIRMLREVPLPTNEAETFLRHYLSYRGFSVLMGEALTRSGWLLVPPNVSGLLECRPDPRWYSLGKLISGFAACYRASGEIVVYQFSSAPVSSRELSKASRQSARARHGVGERDELLGADILVSRAEAGRLQPEVKALRGNEAIEALAQIAVAERSF